MPLLENLALGLETAFRLDALLFCLGGVTLGTFVGVLPGIGALATISMLLPITYYLEPTTALIMLAGVFYGAQYGGSTASILLNTPGTVTNAVTCLDGYPMAKNGQAGLALFITTISSFVGGSFAIIVMMFLAPVLATVALSFGSAEYFAVMLFGLVSASTLSPGSPLKGVAMVALGVVLGLVGMDMNSGRLRYTFGTMELSDGLNLVAVAMGLFGFAEILVNLMNRSEPTAAGGRVSFRSLIPTRAQVRTSVGPTIRGTLIGSAAGILPGAGASIASFMSYAAEKRISRHPEKFGSGVIEGIAAPEASNNAAVQAAFIPTLSLGIPGDAVMAVLLGALMIHGIVPGPDLVPNQPAMFWGLIVSFWIGNLFLLILNIPLIGVWVSILRIPYKALYPAMLFFICIGVYSTGNSVFDIYVTIFFGVVGYFMLVTGLPAAPLLLGFVLGPLLEIHLRRALLISDGDIATLVESWVSTGFLLATAAVLILSLRAPLAKAIGARAAHRKTAPERPPAE